ncbi:MerR family transcriptional regulator [Nocardia mangyaensis]|uniref:MerR family transcriptional regulator n=1 Tax=Nocardia mangyaensis TaxID=2213200 RepID=A0A1J0VXX0_9NOCA|nr:MerR family transcriptional regulator [Nocardia mangyaensis]APE36878.1 MerR family transcriptional regulator [Nocardia mangyaensis]
MADALDRAHLQIGQVAERTELSIKTIRHYDEVGLVTPSARSAGGFRLYTEADVERLLVIRRMKPLGFTLEQMRELLEALDILDDSASSAELRAHASSVVRECNTAATMSCAKLRRQVDYAEEFTAFLIARDPAETQA